MINKDLCFKIKQMTFHSVKGLIEEIKSEQLAVLILNY